MVIWCDFTVNVLYIGSSHILRKRVCDRLSGPSCYWLSGLYERLKVERFTVLGSKIDVSLIEKSRCGLG